MRLSKKKIISVFGTAWILIGVSFFVRTYFTFEAKNLDESVLTSDSSVNVLITDRQITFIPNLKSESSLIFYPGALVDPFSYAPLCRKLSENGYESTIIRMPWRMASKGYNRIKEMGLLANKPKKPVLVGHSQGGKMAAQFVYENPSAVEKLVLLGTTHPRDIDLSGFQIDVLKVYGENDGVANADKVISNKPKLPPDTEYVEIEGGNHSQFGHYGFQAGDNPASITREEQQCQTVDRITEFIERKERAAAMGRSNGSASLAKRN